MTKTKIFALMPILMALGLAACTVAGSSSAKPTTSSLQPSSAGQSSKNGSSSKSSTSVAPSKSVTITSLTLANEDGKAYVVAVGTQENYTAENFTWAWGLRIRNGDFVDGKETPAAADFKVATFDASSKSFTLKYCLTDIEDLSASNFYRVYGGTPESYGDLAFTTENTGARDATRSYYLRTDEENSIKFDNVQPIAFSKAAIANVTADDIPTGSAATQLGAYVKFGGENTANLTMEIIDGWNTAGKIAGNFQRVIGGGYSIHDHVAAERFWKIEGENIFFYCYIGFIAESEGWMVHFDCVGGDSGANLQFSSSIEGETTTVVDGVSYTVSDNRGLSGESNYWGCLGVFRNPAN